jgi:hypothetical protein
MIRVNPRRTPLHKSPVLVTGMLLLVLGIGNWVAGGIRSTPYVEYLARSPGPRSTNDLKARLLDPPDEERERRDIARAKLDFYQLVQSGGRLMILFGVVCLLLALLRLGRDRPRRRESLFEW